MSLLKYNKNRNLVSIFLIILSCLFFISAIICLIWRQVLSPALSFLGLLMLSFNGSDGYPVLPLNSAILISWLSMAVVVTLATIMQAPAVRAQSRGMGYIIVGALAGMAVGLLGFTFTNSLMLLNGIMIIGVLAGIFFGFILYANTPNGAAVKPGSGYFFKYLLAKGFPAAITIMQTGVALVLAIALNNTSPL